jgi:phytol kinase
MKLGKKIITFIIFIIFLVSLYFDSEIVKFINEHRIDFLDKFMVFITNSGLFLILSIISIYLVVAKKYVELILLIIASLLTLECSYILKKLFQMPRPQADITAQLTYATGYTFPSIHSAICFSIVPFVSRIFKNRWLIYGVSIILISIAISRTYLGVHFASDIFFGGLIGYIFAYTVIFLEKKHQIGERLIYHLISKREVRRQVAHFVTGIVIVLLLKLNIINIYILGIILGIGGILSLISLRVKVPILYKVLEIFERPEEIKKFPGKGSFFLVLGAALSLLFFEKQIALAAIAIMAVGDSLTTLIGIYFGKIKNPLNPKKHLEGTILAILLGTLAAFNFVPFQKAIFASTVAMIFEALTVKRIDRIIDDNVLIPIIAGIIMTIV